MQCNGYEPTPRPKKGERTQRLGFINVTNQPTTTTTQKTAKKHQKTTPKKKRKNPQQKTKYLQTCILCGVSEVASTPLSCLSASVSKAVQTACKSHRKMPFQLELSKTKEKMENNMQHVFSSAVSEVALTVNPGFLFASISKAVSKACKSIKKRHFQRALKKQENLEKTMTRPRKIHKQTCNMSTFSRLREFPHPCKMHANRIQRYHFNWNPGRQQGRQPL